MQRCIQLAALGRHKVKSNPMVGALLVYKNRILGEGYHQKYGEAHAEINCLESVKKRDVHLIPNATLYVSLEPCSHTGKTPPCSLALLKAGIKKVVVGTMDSNPLVAGKGIQFLRAHNVSVEVGFCEAECLRLNKVFFTNHKEKRAFIKLKWAETADGFISKKNEPIRISNEYTNIINHKYRTETDAILVGYQTAITDRPQLDARHWKGKQPARIYLDWQACLLPHLIPPTGQRTIILNTIKTETRDNIEYIKVEKDPRSLAKKILELGITSVLVEGGAATHSFFMAHNTLDEALVIQSNQTLGAGTKAAIFSRQAKLSSKPIFDDTVYHYSNSSFIL